MKTLVIAEKPSVAQDLARALTPTSGKFDKSDIYFENEHYIITSAVGHLVEIAAPEKYEVKRGKWSFNNLPVLPPKFDVRPIEKNKKRLNQIVKLARRKDVQELVNACDAGREGELIFRLIQQYSKSRLPSRRLWLRSMTPQAIREGFDDLRSDEDMQPLADAARSRSEADWLVGINGTRAMTAFNSRDGGFFLTTVGRVQTPTLTIVVEREEEIRRHVPQDYWEITADFAIANGEYQGKWFDPDWKKPAKGSKDAENANRHDRANRLWDAATAQAIVDAVAGQPAQASDVSKPSRQSSPLLFDLTSLQREANSKFGYSAKATLSLAQSLYEKHKVLTYPRTDSRALPEDYVGVVQQTFEALTDHAPTHIGQHAQKALADGYIKPNKRIFNNRKVSDHFAIIPTPQAPKKLSEAEQKIYDLVTRRFIAIFFPPAEYSITTRTSVVQVAGESHHFKTEGKVLVKPGWLAVYGKAADATGDDADGSGKQLPALAAATGETAQTEAVELLALQTRPPARYTEATLLGAMEGAGKMLEDDELRLAMQEKGLGTPATRAATIEGLLREKYLLREGRELMPTAKAFQLLTLLRGLGVQELSKPALTGEWEHKLSLIEQKQLERDAFMREISSITQNMVEKARNYDQATVVGDYIRLSEPCPNCGGIIKENYRRYACIGDAPPKKATATTETTDTAADKTIDNSKKPGCGFSFTKSPGGRMFELGEADAFVRDRHIGPLQGFRSKAGWPFAAELNLVNDAEADGNWKLEFDFGKKEEESTDPVDFSGAESLGKCPQCSAAVYAHGSNYVCEKTVPTPAQEKPSCKFKTGKIILQQPIEPEQVRKLLETGKTDLLDKFISNRTRRAFKAFLVWDEKAGKVGFEFAPRASKKTAKKATKKAVKKTAEKAVKKAAKKAAKKTAKKAVKKTTAKKAAVRVAKKPEQ